MPTSSLLKGSSNKAAALIIVLAFVVLLTGLGVAYLSRATTDRQLAHTSFHDTDADLLARSALDIVVGDFKQEIANGSTKPAVTPSITPTTIYMPTSAANVVPQRGSQIAAGVPNLIRRSVRLDNFSGNPAQPSLASAVNSQDDPSANGRSISSTRWNSHYLVPKGNTATNDSSPIPAFTNATPDWVFVRTYNPVTPTQSPGPFVITSPDPLVVGRYAYAVYDEGGLLDINVAGYPSPTPAALPPSAPSVRDVGRKGALAFADLTALPTTPGNFMTATDINTLIGFRNYATMQLSGVSGLNFPTFSASAVSNFFNYFTMPSPIPATSPLQIGTSKDFGVVNNVSTGSLSDLSLRTDQSFISRAELINFFQSTGIASVNTLQYLSTFSREQNKPTLQLTTAWPAAFTRVVLPQRYYIGNLNLAVYPSPTATPTPTGTPTGTPIATPTGTPTLTPTIRTALGLQFVMAVTPPPATPTPTPTPGPCDLQVRWEYVGGQNTSPSPTPLLAIPAFPSDLTTLDFFQYINYALFGVTTADSADMPFTLGIGAALIDQYDADALATGIYYGSNLSNPCDGGIPPACLVYGAEQNQNATEWSLLCISPLPPQPSANTIYLNRAFRTVGEFGYAYSVLNAANGRNSGTTPAYLTDFKDPYNSSGINPNPDPVLLDFFTYNSAPVRSGIVSLNTQQPLVLAAILQGAIYNNSSSSVVSNSDAATAANSIVNATATTPAMSRADIARLASVVPSLTFNSDQEGKDTIARALSEVVQTRTWGLLIDLVAQTGHYKPNATSLTNDFVVEGEKRYWLHVAIDRFDGTIVGQRLEEVTE